MVNVYSDLSNTHAQSHTTTTASISTTIDESQSTLSFFNLNGFAWKMCANLQIYTSCYSLKIFKKKLTYLRILKKCREQANVLNEICQEGRLLRT